MRTPDRTPDTTPDDSLDDTPDDTVGRGCLDRRCVLAAAAAGVTALLTGCSTYGQTASAPADPPSAAPAPAASAGTAAASPGGTSQAAGGAGAQGIAALADVPVGGGTVLADAKIVLTQPTAGVVRAYSAVCTHAGCTVADVASGTINCPCHGSRFAIADGSVVGGPAPRPLAAVAVRVDGDRIVRA
jgi:Rieske Fe-S protein